MANWSDPSVGSQQRFTYAAGPDEVEFLFAEGGELEIAIRGDGGNQQKITFPAGFADDLRDWLARKLYNPKHFGC